MWPTARGNARVADGPARWQRQASTYGWRTDGAEVVSTIGIYHWYLPLVSSIPNAEAPRGMRGRHHTHGCNSRTAYGRREPMEFFIGADGRCNWKVQGAPIGQVGKQRSWRHPYFPFSFQRIDGVDSSFRHVAPDHDVWAWLQAEMASTESLDAVEFYER